MIGLGWLQLKAPLNSRLSNLRPHLVRYTPITYVSQLDPWRYALVPVVRALLNYGDNKRRAFAATHLT